MAARIRPGIDLQTVSCDIVHQPVDPYAASEG